ncbi:MAG: hypothetical protein AB7N24_11920 [Dehalococcoidia bacterium]
MTDSEPSTLPMDLDTPRVLEALRAVSKFGRDPDVELVELLANFGERDEETWLASALDRLARDASSD